MRTPVRWAGSKKTLLPVLRPYWPKTAHRYIEPFCGSACFFFDLEPDEAILSDINRDLIATYRAIRHEPSRVSECLLRLPPDESTYYSLRETDPRKLSEIEQAARFIFLNRLCFNGIYRTNRNGVFNVPYAKPKYLTMPEVDTLVGMSQLLKKATLLDGDFEKTLEEASHGDFVYLDPPYALAKRRVFAEYHPDSFSGSDLHRLKAALHSMQDRGVHFLVSYADCAEGRDLVSGWIWRRVRTRRNVAGFAAHRRAAYELIASNLELPNGD